MAAEKRSSGGVRPGAGRKPKADEIALIERLSPMDDIAFKALEKGIKKGKYPFLKLFMEYRFSKPKESLELNLQGNPPETLIIHREIFHRDLKSSKQ